MLRAHDLNNNNIYPRRGASGFCPNCGAKVKAFCGKIYTHHWRHLESEYCDNWGEKESEWHRDWKNRFPLDWQEVIIKERDEQHIADVKNQIGIVLELQNSPISPDTIRVREDFYGHMVWLVNAAPFKGHFQIHSKVKKKLRSIEDYYSFRETSLNLKDDDYGDEYEDLNDNEFEDLQKFEEEFATIDWNLTHEKRKLERLMILVEDLEKRSEDSENSLKDIMDSKNFYSNRHIEYRAQFPIGYKNNTSKIKILEKQNDEIQVKLDEIELLPGCSVEGLEKYKFVGQTKVGSHHFRNCCLLSRDFDTTLFPEVRYFKSEWNFEQNAHDPKCHLLMDPAPIVDELKNEMKQLAQQKEALKKTNHVLMEQLQKGYDEYLELQLKERKKEIKSIRNNIKLMRPRMKQLAGRIDELKAKANERRESSRKVLMLQKEKERKEIMKQYKGVYGYRWKYRRKSWDYASAPIFLDFGEHIFKIVGKKTLRKFTVDDFILAYKSGSYQGRSIFDD